MIRFLRLRARSNADEDIEILALRHQLAVLRRQIDKPRLTPADRAFLAALLPKLPRPTLRRLLLLVSPETVLRWHRDLLRRRHARLSRPKRPGRHPTVRRIRTLVPSLARDNPRGGYRRIHGELAILGIKVAPSTVWEILKTHGIPPAPDRAHLTWATFLRSQAHALLAADVIKTPTLIRDRDSKYTAAFDAVVTDSGITTITTGIRIPRMNAITKRWIQTCRTELLDRTLILNPIHLLHVLREFEAFYNHHRTHRALHAAAPLRPLPQPITKAEKLDQLTIRRRDRLGGILHEYHHAS